jgi:hypothetical protein
MEQGELSAQTGIVKRVTPQGEDILVEIETTDAFGTSTTLHARVCRSESQGSTDAMNAAHFQIKYSDINDARKSKEKIEFGTRGPFNTCLSFVRPVAG